MSLPLYGSKAFREASGDTLRPGGLELTGYGLELTLEQYVLVGSTVRSYLAWLVDGGQVTYGFDQNRLLWERA